MRIAAGAPRLVVAKPISRPPVFDSRENPFRNFTSGTPGVIEPKRRFLLGASMVSHYDQCGLHDDAMTGVRTPFAHPCILTI